MSNEPTTIPALLQRWSEVQPEVCQKNVVEPTSSKYPAPITYTITRYTFWFDEQLFAMCMGVMFTGRPASAWLRDAVEAAVEASPGICSYQTECASGYCTASIWGASADGIAQKTTAAHALLAAFVAWAEGVRE